MVEFVQALLTWPELQLFAIGQVILGGFAYYGMTSLLADKARLLTAEEREAIEEAPDEASQFEGLPEPPPYYLLDTQVDDLYWVTDGELNALSSLEQDPNYAPTVSGRSAEGP